MMQTNTAAVNSITATGQSISISIIAFCPAIYVEMIVSSGRGCFPFTVSEENSI